MSQRMEAGILDPRFLQPPDDHLGNQIRPQVVAIRLAEDQTQVFVVASKKAPMFGLLFVQKTQRRNRASWIAQNAEAFSASLV